VGTSFWKVLAPCGLIKTLGRGRKNDYSNDLTSQAPALDTYFQAVIHGAGKAHIVPRKQQEADVFST
jgi:hypothetical protein